MKQLLILATSFVISMMAQAQTSPEILSFPQHALKAELTWLENSPAVGPESKLQIQWRNEQGEAVEIPSDFRVALFMPDMGHGSSPTKIAKLEGVGLYRVNKIYFTMPGLWEVRVTLKPVQGEPETALFSLEL